MTVDALHCERRPRRDRIRIEGWNGLDELEVSNDQRILTVSFLAKAPDEIDASNVRIDGPAGAAAVRVKAVRLCRDEDPDRDDCMRVIVREPGDFSTYTLRVVQADARGRPGDMPLKGFDPRYAAIDFSFKAGCPNDEDCAIESECPPEPVPEPAFSYLAKDYESFRQLILDRMALIMPSWHERHVPDLGITLVELLAYAGDELSYFQDAVATEAYLDTARRRVSVRRHVRLVDYRMHEGCNARAWVCVEVSEDVTLSPDEICFATTVGGPVVAWENIEADVRGGEAEAYELVDAAPVALRVAHNRIELWTWGDSECCLARGATRATLKDSYLDQPDDEDDEHGTAPAARYKPQPKPPRRRALDALKQGAVLIFEELIGPATGNPADADPRHRQAVRVTSLTRNVDELYDQPIVEVEWEPDDALTFALCVSTIAGEDCAPIHDVSVVRGNVLLVDHGVSVTRCGVDPEPLEPREARRRLPACEGPCDPAEPILTPAPYTPALRRAPVTHSTKLPDPSIVGERQAQRIARIPRRVRALLDALIDDARAGTPLTQADLEWLVLLFGAHELRDAGLRYPRPRPRRGRVPRAELEALERLSARETRLLARKVRRTNTLAAHARAGEPLTASQHEELAEMWGEDAAAWADPPGHALWGPANGTLLQDPRQALAAIWVEEDPDDGPALRWSVRADLLASGPADCDFVVEIDDDGVAHLRFVDGRLGRAPAPGARLSASYRVGNGALGNVAGKIVSLDREYPNVIDGDWAVLEDAPASTGSPLITRIQRVTRTGVSAYLSSGTVTRLELAARWLNVDPSTSPLSTIRGVTIHVPLRTLTAAPVPDEALVERDRIDLDGVYQGLTSGRSVIVAGERVDVPDSQGVTDGELAMIAAVEQTVDTALPGDSVHTVITLATTGLAFKYRRATTKIYANVVKATQGETVSEVLGGGDPARSLQSFQLSRKPLTYLPAATALGAASTLQVRVDDLLWHEGASLARMGPTDRAYLLRTAEDDTTRVVFGRARVALAPPPVSTTCAHATAPGPAPAATSRAAASAS